MEFKHTIEIITKDIQDIEKLLSNFNNYSSIPNIELDLALSKLRNVYDVLLMLRENESVKSFVTKRFEPVDSPKLQKIEEKKQSVTSKDKIPAEVEEEVLKSTADSENLRVPDADIFEVESPVQNKKTTHSKKSVPKPGKIVAEKLSGDRTFINEMLGEQFLKTDISSIHQQSPIKTIAGSIGINDKFFFMRELFNNDPELYKRTLKELDNSVNFNAAYSMLMNNFNWDMKSDPVQMLLNLVRRKFISPGNE